MNEREMLELSARAVGKKLVFDYDENFPGPCVLDDDFPISWNPREDGDDAFRLAVDLNMTIYIGGIGRVIAIVYFDDGLRIEIIEPYDNDKHAATRLAITKCAAEVGRRMK